MIYGGAIIGCPLGGLTYLRGISNAAVVGHEVDP